MPFGFEAPSIHGVNRITAHGCTVTAFTSPDPRAGRLTLIFVDGFGKSVEQDIFAGPASSAYVLDLAAAINRVARDHGLLTADEQRELLDGDDADALAEAA